MTDNSEQDPRMWYWQAKFDLIEAAMVELTPTSIKPQWWGKFRCMWCEQRGYTWHGSLTYKWWWGHEHGRNCAKRP